MHFFLAPLVFILGKNGLTECYRMGEATGNDLLFVLKGLSFFATRSQSLDTGFQIQEKNNPLEILLTNDFKVLQ